MQVDNSLINFFVDTYVAVLIRLCSFAELNPIMRSKFHDYLFNRNPSDCVVCAIGPTFKFASLFGTFLGSYSCIHLKRNKDLKTEFKTSKAAVVYNQILMLLLLAAMVWFVYLISSRLQEQKFVIMELLAEIFYCTGGFITLLFHALKFKCRNFELNTWVRVLQSRCKYGLNSILDVKETRRIRVLGIIHCLIIAVAILCCCLYASVRSYDTLISSGTVRRPIAILAGFVQATAIFNFNVEIIFVDSLLRNCYKSLQLQMIDHLDQKESNKIPTQRRNQIEIKIQMTRRIHTSIYGTCMYLGKVMNTFFLWWFELLVLAVIFNCYLLASMLSLDAYNDYVFAIVMRTMILVCVMTYFLTSVEKASNVVSAYEFYAN